MDGYDESPDEDSWAEDDEFYDNDADPYSLDHNEYAGNTMFDNPELYQGDAQVQNQNVYTFDYEELKDPKRYIRVVEVRERHEGEPIQCALRALTREKAHSNYRALSYTWGNEKLDMVIELNDQLVSVTRNLWDFLDHASRAKRERRVGWTMGRYWIDFLCINQKDLGPSKEKPIQLKYMRDVYSSAHQTIVWLGTQRGPLKSAFRDLTELQSEIEEWHSQRHYVPGCISDLDGMGTDSISAWVQKTISPSTETLQDSLIEAMMAILDSKYWERVWILQEIAASDQMRMDSDKPLENKIRVVCGDSEFTWWFFSALPLVIQLRESSESEQMRLLQKRIRQTQGLWLICWLFSQAENSYNAIAGFRVKFVRRLDLPLLIFLSERSKASRPKDYIYGLVGLVQEGWGSNIDPEDDLSGCQVLHLTMKKMVRDADRNSAPRVAEYMHRLWDRIAHDPPRPTCCGTRCNSGPGCEKQHKCNALVICRRMARTLFFKKNMMTLEVKKKFLAFDIKRDSVDIASPTVALGINAGMYVGKALLNAHASYQEAVNKVIRY